MKTHLVFAIATILLLVVVIGQRRKTTFTFDFVVSQAERLSEQPYEPVPPVKSKALRELNYDQYRDIRWKDENTLWRDKALPFQAKFFFTGHIQSQPVNIFQINRDSAGPVLFSPDFFDYGKNAIAASDKAQGGYAGFRVHYPINKPDYLDEFLVFLGASYFRAVGRDQVWGLSARGIAVDTLKKEEFPSFVSFWLVEPAPGARELTIYALMDGPSITGAFEFVASPGPETSIRVRSVLFPRRDIDGIGLAPLTSMFWYGENTGTTFGDFRPEVHDSDGLLMELANGEWLWRPLSWAKQLQVSVLQDNNPRGFGLLQRDRVFEHYGDMEARYHLRPSAWVRPEGDWGKGAVELVQIPTNNEFMDNIVAYWRPDGGLKKGTRSQFSYTLSFFNENPALPPLGRCTTTWIDYRDAPYFRVIVLEFSGGGLDALTEDAPPQPDIWVGTPAKVSDIQVVRNTFNKTWRVQFTVSAGDRKKPIEMRCALQRDGKPLTETWTMTWTP